MPLGRLTLALTLVAVSYCPHGESLQPPHQQTPGMAFPAEAPEIPPPDFALTVQPVLQRNCSPCHFPSGVMHGKLPFDDPETVREVGSRIFSRIRKPEDQATLRAFLEPDKINGSSIQ